MWIVDNRRQLKQLSARIQMFFWSVSYRVILTWMFLSILLWAWPATWSRWGCSTHDWCPSAAAAASQSTLQSLWCPAPLAWSHGTLPPHLMDKIHRANYKKLKTKDNSKKKQKTKQLGCFFLTAGATASEPGNTTSTLSGGCHWHAFFIP